MNMLQIIALGGAVFAFAAIATYMDIRQIDARRSALERDQDS